ncbi:unnamed protein product [Arabidopsis thaliana]|uniref:Putative serine carboxypeptidase-like 54 n=2 Tax=Arabidopsis thaliana TaxID=3702 RepID=SCP54_ARATH|nr:alpha/beta-Hydrolases superfamily protein [Arabidopsis thaliana]Q9FFB2.1 PUTATIVE PSEUDOGENE: RecName: Full=Putative serine carboxypeptidase-like 54; Flags: Precursor [Arabidopsis thaliana]AED93101.1 alpha/beta-Hydrolases superfamily protein [Arabidopsis thaliana]BAB10617.1 unnamed protein product [Arabidopsis thaliana]VYS67637.1 unnamed protein product [Arabidopsis thaliana]|eukprot:NP_197687.1 alpha/beta-Hydrolases superfamily protein [Arabidopsis thaliana]
MATKTFSLPFLLIVCIFSQLSSTFGDPSVKDLGQHAGYFSLPRSKSARLFHFFFQSRNNSSDPVVIWLSGGPGCSSSNQRYISYLKISNLIYVDQPIRTGFSYANDSTDLRHDEDSVSNDLYDFLQAFFKEHPNLAKDDFYITGESYAGHYIPALASRVHNGNEKKEGIVINLKVTDISLVTATATWSAG